MGTCTVWITGEWDPCCVLFVLTQCQDSEVLDSPDVRTCETRPHHGCMWTETFFIARDPQNVLGVQTIVKKKKRRRNKKKRKAFSPMGTQTSHVTVKNIPTTYY